MFEVGYLVKMTDDRPELEVWIEHAKTGFGPVDWLPQLPRYRAIPQPAGTAHKAREYDRSTLYPAFGTIRRVRNAVFGTRDSIRSLKIMAEEAERRLDRSAQLGTNYVKYEQRHMQTEQTGEVPTVALSILRYAKDWSVTSDTEDANKRGKVTSFAHELEQKAKIDAARFVNEW